jgi:hypothetical protein
LFGVPGVHALAGFTAVQTVCQSTPSRRATAETVVWSHANAATAHFTARVVSLARTGMWSWVSLHVPAGQAE